MKLLKALERCFPHSHRSLAAVTLRQVGIVVAAAGFFFSCIGWWVMSWQFDRFDAQQYAQDGQRVAMLLQRDADLMRGFVLDYATWDQAYEYVYGRNDKFVTENFTFATLNKLQFHGVAVVSHTGQVRIDLEWDANDNETIQPLSAGVLEWIRQEAKRSKNQPANYHFIWLEQRPMLIADAPIIHHQTWRRSDSRLYFIRYLDGYYQQLIQNLTGTSFVFTSDSPAALPVIRQGQQWQAQKKIAPGMGVYVKGETRLEPERRVVLLLLVGNGILLVVVSLAGIYYTLQRRVLGRLNWFAKRAVRVQETHDHSIRWPVEGEDELDHLALALNQLQVTVAQRQRELQQVAYYDSLTGLPNRRSLLDYLTRLLQDSSLTRVHILMLLDLDHFKKVNDTKGHLQGDELLIEVGDRLLEFMAGEGMVARLGGDEFVVVAPEVAQDKERALNKAEHMAQAILAVLMQPSTYIYREQGITASIGITVFDNTVGNIHDLLLQADLAMYHSKALGRNGFYSFHPELQVSAQQRVDLERELAQAIVRGQLSLYYQPQVTYDYQLLGLEALVRWRHPHRGWISPAEFIPLAEETGLIVPLGNWVLTTACTQLAEWVEHPLWRDIHVGVNVSAHQLHQPDFVSHVLTTLERTGANPQRLTLELTESVMLNDPDGVVHKMQTLSQSGIRFSLDDFGVGYSALTYLKRLPLHQIKIDRCFVQQVHESTDDQGIAQMIIALGETLGLDVIAEGVEKEEQRAFLAEHGCCAYQGYFFAPPLSVPKLTAWVQGHTSAPSGMMKQGVQRSGRAVTTGDHYLQGQRPGEQTLGRPV
ncbi:MAG: EAL domain-containing protein [Gloeomargarita sp. HHBFW_bins_162]